MRTLHSSWRKLYATPEGLPCLCKYRCYLHNSPYQRKKIRKDFIMKKTLLTLILGFLSISAVHAQQMVVIQRPGIFSDIATATGTILSLPFTLAEGVVVGTIEAAASLVHCSTEVIVVPSTTHVPAPVVVVTPQPIRPSTTIITTHGNGTITTVTRQTSAYELGPVIIAPVDPNHRVGNSPHVNPYVYRPR